jgi:hypothetical protein
MNRKTKATSIDYRPLIRVVIFVGLSVWLIFAGVWFGWVGLTFGALGLTRWGYDLRTQLRQSRTRENVRRYDRAMLERIAAEANTPAEDIEVWKALLNDLDVSWVAYENGTAVVYEGDGEPQERAAQIIEEFRDAPIGSGLADFSVSLVPHLGVWLVRHASGAAFNFVRLGSCYQETAAGMLARELLREDAAAKCVVHIYRAHAA